MEIQKALVVDDSKLARLALGRLLKERSIAVEEAASGEEALVKARQDRPDVVFMDVLMPGMDGYETTKALVHDPATQGVPVVMCTSKAGEEDKARAKEVGAVSFMVKPVNAEALDKALAEVQGYYMEKEVERMLEVPAREEAEQAAREAVERIAEQVVQEAAQKAVEGLLRREGQRWMLEALKGVREALKREFEAHAVRLMQEQARDFLASQAVKDTIGKAVQESTASLLQREALTLRQSAEEAARHAALQTTEQVAREAAEQAVETSLAPLRRGLWLLGVGWLVVVIYLALLAWDGIFPHLWPSL